MSYAQKYLKLYFSSLEDYKVLSTEEQHDLVKKAQAGDIEARDTLLLSNTRFVVTLAAKYKTPVPIEELISEGTLGVLEAISKFDPKKNVSFISYAALWIKHYIERTIYSSGNSVRLPMNKVRMLNKVRSETQHLVEKEGVTESVALKKAVEDLDIDVTQVKRLMESNSEVFSLNQEKNIDTEMTFQDSLEGSTDDIVENLVEELNTNEFIMKVIKKIPSREAAIIEKRFGLNGQEPHSLAKLSKEYGVTKERVRQLEVKGLERMRKIYIEMESGLAQTEAAGTSDASVA